MMTIPNARAILEPKMLIHFCMRSPDKAVKKNDHFNGTLQNAHIFKWTPVFTAKKRQLNEWGVGGGGGGLRGEEYT